jgi:hypothetical protein
MGYHCSRILECKGDRRCRRRLAQNPDSPSPLPPEQYLLSRHSEARCRAYLIRLSPLRSQHQSRDVMSVDEQATGLAGKWTDGDGQKASSVRSR